MCKWIQHGTMLFKCLSCTVSKMARQCLCTSQSKYSPPNQTEHQSSTTAPAQPQFLCRTVELGSSTAGNSSIKLHQIRDNNQPLGLWTCLTTQVSSFLNSKHGEKQQLVLEVISMKNGKHERSWKVSLVPPYTWKQALIKTNCILKNWKEGERGNLTDLCLEKKAEMKAEQREETVLHPKDNIQALPMIYLQFLTAVWSGINSPDHLPAVPELGESAGRLARTKLSVRNCRSTAPGWPRRMGQVRALQILPAPRHLTASSDCHPGFPWVAFSGGGLWVLGVFPGWGEQGSWVSICVVVFFFFNPSAQPCAPEEHANLRSCLVINWLPNPFSSA